MRSAIALDVIDPARLAQRTAQALHPTVGLSFTGVAIREEAGLFAMHGVMGGRNETVLRQIRVSSGQGLGGKVVALREPVLVTDYVHDPAITTHFRDLAILESLGAMAAVPVIADGDVMAIIYAATRDASCPGGDAIAQLDQAAAGLADLFGVAVRHRDAVSRQAAAERLRIAEQLHDTVGQLLFAIGASARRLRTGDDGTIDLDHVSEIIERNATEAARMLRDALHQLTPRAPEESLPVAVGVGVEEFSQANGIAAHLVVLGEPRTLSSAGAGALLNVVREGLLNAARHADPGVVIVTLAYSADAIDVIVQDDGRGLPARFALKAIPGRATPGGFGLPSLLRRMQQLGGSLDIRRAPQGGTTLRATFHDHPARPSGPAPQG
ncbi:MAG TPA: ATP-binding protein [Acidimicrobiia bacterium]|nr:ATP-binding protein [Acidimicrobiia bacterium]